MNFSTDKYLQFLNDGHIGKNIYYINKTKSTNTTIWNYYNNNDFLLLVTDIQTQGRGRRENKWFSEPYKSLIFSIAFPDDNKNSCLIALKAGIAISKAINEITSLDAQTKWPNDILIKNKKVAGILIESSVKKNKKVLCLGVGINVNIEENSIPNELKNQITSLFINKNKIISREKLLAEINIQLDLLLYKDDPIIIKMWTELCAHKNSKVKFFTAKNELIEGTFINVDDNGNALINHEGKVHSYSSGVLSQ